MSEELPTMNENEWPVYAVLMNNGDLYWHDTSCGNRYGCGDGWFMVLPWGEAKKYGGFHGDNRFGVEHENVSAFTLLTPSPDPGRTMSCVCGGKGTKEYDALLSAVKGMREALENALNKLEAVEIEGRTVIMGSSVAIRNGRKALLLWPAEKNTRP